MTNGITLSVANGAITESVARKVLEVVDAGLVKGLGKAIPGQMCVEAAVWMHRDVSSFI